MSECKSCNDTGAIRTTLLDKWNGRYSFSAKACKCSKGSKFINPFEESKNEKERYQAIEKMNTQQVFQYIRDTIGGKDWSGGIDKVKVEKEEFELSEDCPF